MAFRCFDRMRRVAKPSTASMREATWWHGRKMGVDNAMLKLGGCSASIIIQHIAYRITARCLQS